MRLSSDSDGVQASSLGRHSLAMAARAMLQQPLASDVDVPVAEIAKPQRFLVSASGSLLPPTPQGRFRDDVCDWYTNIMPSCLLGWCIPAIIAAQLHGARARRGRAVRSVSPRRP